MHESGYVDEYVIPWDICTSRNNAVSLITSDESKLSFTEQLKRGSYSGSEFNLIKLSGAYRGAKFIQFNSA